MAAEDRSGLPTSEAPAQSQSGASALAPEAEAQLDLGDFKIDRAGEIPIGVQLAWALRARIGDGRLAPGQRLPGLRELAEMLGINANTARTVYQRLEQEGLIDSFQGTGTFVASVARESSAVGQIAADAARQAHQTGVDPRQVAAALYVSGEACLPPHTESERETLGADAMKDTPNHAATHKSRSWPAQPDSQAERRRQLRAQIAALEQALAEIQSSHPGLIPTPSKPPRHAGPRLLSVEELERVRTDLVRRLASAEPFLQEPIPAKRATAKKRGSAAESDPAITARAPGKALPERKAPRPQPRTRPSTA